MRALIRILAVVVVLAGMRAAAGAAPAFSFYGTSGVFTPGAPVRVSVVSRSAVDVEVGVVPIALDELVSIVRGDADPRLGSELMENRRAIKTVRARTHASASGATTPIDVGVLKPGLYGLRLRLDGYVRGVQLANVTTLGVMTADTGGGFTAFAIDLRTRHARGDVIFTRYARGSAAGVTLRSDPSGLAAFEGPVSAGEDDVLVAHGEDGSAAVPRGVLGWPDSSAQSGYVQADRPLYRPGHRVMYRAILRDGTPGAYTIPRGAQTVWLKNPSGKTVFSAPCRPDEFGACSGQITLPDDSELGEYSLSAGSDETHAVSSTIVVEAYKKPEYVVDVNAPPAITGGDAARFRVAARYLFGRPAARMKLHYRAYFHDWYAWWRSGSPYRFEGYSAPDRGPDPPGVEGDAVADAAGRATLAIRTSSVTSEKQLSIEVDARDDAGRTVTAEATTEVTPAAFYLTVSPKTYYNPIGDTVELAVHSRTYALPSTPRPSVPVTVSFARYWWDARQQHDEEPADTQSVVTDAHGDATVRWKPSRAGYFEVTARSRDERGRAVATTTGVWIAAARYERPYAFDSTTVVPQKTEYRPGERVSLLVTTPRGDVDALVHIVGGGADRVLVRRLPTSTSTIEVEPPADGAQFRISVTVPTRTGVSSGEATVALVPPPHQLHVAIAPEKPKYQPGERARFAIRVADANGKPVRAQIGLGVIDDAVLALRGQESADEAYDAFYGAGAPYRLESISWAGLDEPLEAYVGVSPPLKTIGRAASRSAAALLTPGQPADAYSISVAAVAPVPRPSFTKLRTDFRDTAYWTPAVVTGDDGRAIVTFDWPDSLTSYTARGLAVTPQTDVGGGLGHALVTKDFLVRLAAPRFLRRGDAAHLTGIAQGTPRAKTALLRFSAPELGVADVTTAPLRFDASATATAGWTVRGGELGSAPLRLAGTSGALRDGLRIALPVESAGTAEHERAAGSLPSSASLALQLPRGAEAGELRVDLAPSALAQLVAGVHLLQVYPYYCVEQTMSAALPAIYVDRMRKRIKLPPPEGPAPADVAKRAVDRLVQLQHADGSWGWWDHDDANPFMTAYALYGLAELAHSGYAVPPQTLERGAASLAAQAVRHADTLAFWGGRQTGSEWNTRAFMLFALADAKPQAVDRELLAKTDAQAKTLNSYALAVLGLAHVELNDRAGAQPLLAELLRRTADDGTSVHWKGAGWHYGWEDDPIETTAYALRFIHAMTPDDPRVARAVTWLRAQQHGSWFETTKDTAAAIYAIAEAMPIASNELDPHETVRISLGGRVVKTVRIDTPVLPRADASFTIPAALLRRGGTLRFEREGTGALSWSTDWTRYVREPSGAQLDPAFTVVRTYSAQGGNDWRVGDRIDVELTVTAQRDAQYVAIEDPFPAGLEYQPKEYQTGEDWSGLQFFDDRVIFFAARMSARSPVHLRYALRATTAGSYTAPAPSAYAMYGPPLIAVGRPASVAIR